MGATTRMQTILKQAAIWGSITLVCSYLGLTPSEQQKTDIYNSLDSFFGSILGGLKLQREPPPIPEAKDIADYYKAFEFKKTGESKSLAVINSSFAELKQLQKCMRWEDFPVDTLSNVITNIGEQWNLSSDQVSLMQLSLSGGRVIDALEVFEHGNKGIYRFIQYASARMPNGNYDFIIANYGYSWVLDLLRGAAEAPGLLAHDQEHRWHLGRGERGHGA